MNMFSGFILFARVLWPASWLGWMMSVLVGWTVATSSLLLWPGDKPNPLVAANRPIESAKAGYVTANDCRSCHPANYASWHASFHRTMTQPARPENVIPKLEGFELTVDGWTYRMEQKGDAFFVRKRAVNDPRGNYDEPREIVLLTGSHSLQNFWIATGKARTLEHFPFSWLVAEEAWAPVGDTFLSPPEFHALYSSGDWNDNCIDCHTTGGRARLEKTDYYDSRVSEFGISCEACHGEGKTHIEQNRNPLRRYWAHLTDRKDETVANPARMKGPQSALACGQCHSVWAFNSVDAKIKWTQEGATYRPGQNELPERFVVRATTATDHTEQKKLITQSSAHYMEDRFWGDGMVRVTGREFNGVEASPCYKGSEFSCLSCHEMHPARTGEAVMATWKSSQLKPGADSDQGCVQCHPGIQAKRTEHTHHAADSVGSHCYDCHMPHTTFGLMRALRSHQVSSPNVDESVRFGRPNACNLCHLDKTLAWTADNLHAWYGQKIPTLPADDRTISASVKWLLQGDAGQRALIAWSMGWEPAQKASGREWLAPYLAVTLNDPYAVVRFVAGKSLRSLPLFASFAYRFSADEAQTRESADQAFEQWRNALPPRKVEFAPATLLENDGRFREDFLRLLQKRDLRPIFLVE